MVEMYECNNDAFIYPTSVYNEQSSINLKMTNKNVVINYQIAEIMTYCVLYRHFNVLSNLSNLPNKINYNTF